MTDQPRQLRIALAMRGGVSLAVWMGGACREVARLRAKDGPYAGLLALAGYDDPLVVVDVLAGTSAGGLNGVLMSDHLARGASFDASLRNLWLTVGDLDDLSRRPATKTPPPSLLEGNDGFYAKLRIAMTHFGETKGVPAPHPVRLLVTATRLKPRPNAVFPVIGKPLGATSSRAFFRFRYHGPDLPTLSDFATTTATDQLAYAGRTTSSFPAAFEPALPHVGQGAPAAGRIDMRGISSETGAPDPDFDGAVELMDGGVLDNIPIAWAVRSVSGMPADQPVDRWLLYLQPIATSTPPADPDPKPGAPARIVRLLRAMVSAKMGTESILDDADELRGTDVDARQHDAVLDTTVTIAASADLIAAASTGLASYGPGAGTAEVVRLRALLTDPLTVIGPDPLPIPPVPFPLRELASSQTPNTQDVAPLRMPATPDGCTELVLPNAVEASTVGAQSRTPLAAARAVTFLLRLVRTVERDVPRADTVEVRRRLYDLRFAAEVLVAARDRLLLAVIEDATTKSPEELLRSTTATLASLMPAAPGADTSWTTWAADLAAAVATATPAAPTAQDTWPDSPYAALWSAITDCASDLVTLDPSVRPAGTSTGDWLAATEVVSGAMRPDPLSSPSPMKFAVASAANASPIERILLGQDLSENPELRIDRKLSGNQVSNFASFLSARWRLNDWAWGRLDGAQTLVELVARSDRLAGVTYDQIHELFVGGATGEWQALLEQRWKVHQEFATVDPAAAAQNAIVERIQWDIVREEIPLTVQLAKRSNGKDRPPTTAELDVPISDAPPTAEELTTFGSVGAESVIDLLRRPDLRRTLLRLGLVGWRALLPGGGGGIAANAVLVPTFVTGLYLPILLGLVAPIASIAAGAAMWVAISASSGKTGLLEHLPTAISFVLSCVMYAWQLSAAKTAHQRLLNPPAPGAAAPSFFARWWPRLVAAIGGAGVVAVVVVVTHHRSASFGGHPALLTGALSAAAVLLPLLYLITGGGLKDLVTSGKVTQLPSQSAVIRGSSVIVLAAATGVATWATVHFLHQHWWVGYLAIYEALFLMLVGLLVILSAKPDADQP